MYPKQERPENFTLGDMLQELQELQARDPKRMTQQVRWLGEQGTGKITGLWILAEDHVNPSQEGWEPAAPYLPKEGEEFDPERHLDLKETETWPAGLVLVEVD